MKDVPGYEGRYSATKDGRIFGHKKKIFLKPSLKQKGYYHVCLYPERGKILHRLIAKTYLKNYSEKLQVNHKDLNKTNNNVSNLEMVTNKQNYDHAKKNIKKYFKKNEIIKVIKLREKGMTFTKISKILKRSRTGCGIIFYANKGKYESKKRG